jgi:restriction endonuclease
MRSGHDTPEWAVTMTGIRSMLQDTAKAIHEHVVYDSATERDFAQALECNRDVILYAKLPKERVRNNFPNSNADLRRNDVVPFWQ